MGEFRKKIIVVCGATATGKTRLSVELAQRFDAEIVCADSMQVYRGLDIGTAKVTTEEARGISHHMVDILEPSQRFSVAQYANTARCIIDETLSRDKNVIICGGTGLYIDSICDGRKFLEHSDDEVLKERLKGESTEQLYQKLLNLDPIAAEKIHPNNRKRLERALYVSELSNKPFSKIGEEAIPTIPPYKVLKLHCFHEERGSLYQNIECRVDNMIERGLLKEARYVFDNREIFTTAAAAIGYKEFFPYFMGEADITACIEALKTATRHYAKRQLTWFSRYDAVKVEPSRWNESLEIAKKHLEEFLK